MNTQSIRRRMAGFTLIELLCVMSIAGILSLIAYPSFQGAILKTRRSDALVAMMQLQLAQERYRANHTTYGNLEEIGIAATSPLRHYALSVNANAASAYEAAATANGSQSADVRCRVLKLNIDGFNQTQSSGTDANVDNPPQANQKCWSL